MLAYPLRIKVTSDFVALDSLSTGERRLFSAVKDTPRQDSWLRGRQALKLLAGELGTTADTSSFSFPSMNLSLSHCSEYAIAIGTNSTTSKGIGIDLELDRTPHPDSWRFFLTAEEQRWLASLPLEQQSKESLRLWTIKEAVFKSDPENNRKTLLNYNLPEPQKWQTALPTTNQQEVAYCCIEVDGGFVSTAVFPRRLSLAN